MHLYSPVVMLCIFVAVVAFVGAIAAYVYDRRRFARYGQIARPVMKLEEMFGNQAFRDGNDLVVSGNRSGLPVTVRFSHHESLPALHIRVGAPAAFDLSIAPAQSRVALEKPIVRTSEPMFNLSYTVRSSQPAHAQMFLSQNSTFNTLKELCGPHVVILIGDNSIEYGEMGVLDAATANRANARIRSMISLAGILRRMPEAERVQIEPIQHVKRASLRLAIALGALCGFASLAMATHLLHTAPPLAASSERTIPPGISPIDAPKMGNLAGWHLALPNDYDPEIYEWSKLRGVPVESHFALDLSGSGTRSDSAYVLVNQSGKKRVIVISQNHDVFDTLYDTIAIAARVPSQTVDSIRWAAAPPQTPPGDGLLIVNKANGANTGFVFFFSGRRLISGTPANYQYMKFD